MNLTEAILAELQDRILSSYERLVRWDQFTKDTSFNKWIPYISDCKVKVSHKGTAIETSVQPVTRYVPDLRIRTTDSSGKKISLENYLIRDKEFISRLANIFKYHSGHFPSNRIFAALETLEYCSFESDRQTLPTKNDVDVNLKNNINDFLEYITNEKMRIMSLAPIVGARFDESVNFGDVVFRKSTLEDIRKMAIIKFNVEFDIRTKLDFLNIPTLFLNYLFEIDPNPNDYSLSWSMERLHTLFKDYTRNAISTLRLRSSQKPLGIGYVYHMDIRWQNFHSFRFISEDPSPLYRPIRHGKGAIERDISYFPKILLNRKEIAETFLRIEKARTKLHTHPFFLYLLIAVDLYNKSMEEYDLGWAFLDSVRALEALADFSKRLRGERGTSDSGKKIIRALGLTSCQDADLVRSAYELRSRRLAHAPQNIEIDPVILRNLREFETKTIMRFLSVL